MPHVSRASSSETPQRGLLLMMKDPPVEGFAVGFDVTGADVSFAVGFGVIGADVGFAVGFRVIGADVGLNVGFDVIGDAVVVPEIGAGVVGDLVGWADVGDAVLGDEVASEVVVTVAPVLIVVEDVVEEEGFEQPAMALTSPSTTSDHAPPTSC